MKKILLIAAVMLLGSSGAWAAGTPAGTDINNTATLTYSVGGVNQTPSGSEINSTKDVFIVDRKIDVTIAVNNSPKDVAPGSQQQQLEYTVKNEGNDAETWILTLDENTSDDFDVDTLDDCHLYDTSGNDLGVISSTTGIDINFAIDESKNFKVGCDIPAGGSSMDGKQAEIFLIATIKNRPDNTNDTDTPGSQASDAQNVYAEDKSDNNDAKNNGHFSKGGIYKIKTAKLTATKSSIVISDTTGNAEPHRVPGAKIRYCFDVKNTGSGDAEKVRIHDDFTTDNKDKLDYKQSGILVNNTTQSCNCKNISDTSGTPAASSTDIYIPENANGVTIPAGGNACAYIEAVIQ